MDKDAIATRLKILMNENSVTTKSLASELDITERAMYSYILGERVPGDLVKLKIARRFGVSVDEIFFKS